MTDPIYPLASGPTVGNGQSGAVPGLPAAPGQAPDQAHDLAGDPAPDDGGAVGRAIDSAASHLAPIAAMGLTAGEALSAAIAANEKPAPSDPILSALQMVHERMAAVEAAMNSFAPLLALIPHAGGLVGRLGTVEHIANTALSVVESWGPAVSAIVAQLGGKHAGPAGSKP